MTQVNKNIKYRPSLTEEQLLHIVTLAKCENPLSLTSIQLVSQLAPYVAKIEAGSLVPSYVPSQHKPVSKTQSILESLGHDCTPETEEEKFQASLVKEDLWELAYEKYKENPSSCTSLELTYAQEHRYLNDLMSPEEVKEWERKEFAKHNDSIGE